MLSRLLLAAARHPLIGAIVGMGFAYADFLLPVRRVHATWRVLAFEHPKPSWRTHIVLVPKRRVRSLLAMAQPPHDDHYAEILQAARDVARQIGLDSHDYVLCANGGPRQEVQQVHFHLFTGERYVTSPETAPRQMLYEEDDVIAYHHPSPSWAVHLVVQMREKPPAVHDPRPLGRIAARIIRDLGLDQRGYTLVIDRGTENDSVFHLIAGKRV